MKHQALLLAGLLAAAGSPSSCHRAEYVHTVVQEDGSVDRAVVQDVALTPESAQRPHLWLESRIVKAGPDGFWDGAIAGLPAPDKAEERTYFAARGHFASVGATSDAFFATLAESALEARAVGGPEAWDDSAMKRVTARVAERHGVAWMTDDDLEARARDAISGQVHALVARRDGRPLDPAVVDLITGAVVKIGDKALVSFDKEGGARFQAGLEKEAAARYGGMETLDKRAAILYQRMFGITPFDGERDYEFSLTLPGTIVDANGTLETESRVRWSFRLQEAFAFGYTMRCRSLEPNATSERAVPGAARLTSREAMLRYVALVDGDEELLKVVRQAIAEKSAAPIEAYHSTLAADPSASSRSPRAQPGGDEKQADRAAKVTKLMTLMGMTVK